MNSTEIYMRDNTKSTEQSGDYAAADEVDLKELISVLWAGKSIIIGAILVFGVSSVIYALYQPNMYRSEVLLAPVEQEQSLGGLQGQLGGLASLAGINLGGGVSSNSQLAIEILRSRQFTSDFIQKHNILPELMAADHWDLDNNTLAYDTDKYNESEGKWVREVSPPFKSKPSMQEAYEVFSKLLSINQDTETGMIRLSAEHISASIAQQWVNWLVEDINQTMKTRDVTEAEKSTAFLTTQLEQTKLTDIREVLYKLVEEQTKTIMFANVRDEYVFKTIDPAMVPEEKSGPKRGLICILGAFLGGFIGVIIVFVRHIKGNNIN
jgi:uncharacterized protein involved in exopolysaccharide biosynthesis